MDHKVSKDMISSGMIPSGEKTQADLGRIQYGSAPSPNSLMDAYKSIYEHHQKDADGKVIEHEEKEELNEGKMPEGLKNYLMKKGKKKDDKDMKEMYGGGGTTPLPKKAPKPSPTVPESKPSKPSKPSPTVPESKPSKPSKPSEPSKPVPQMNDVDLFDLVKGRLIDEGCDEQEAINIMVNISEEELNELALGTAGAIAGTAALAGMGINAIRKQMQNKKKMEQGGQFRKGSTMDNIQKKNEMLKQM